MPLLEWIWLVPFLFLPFWAVTCIVPFFVTLVAQYFANIPLLLLVVVAIIASLAISIPSPRIVVAVTLIAIMVVGVSSMVLISISTIVVVAVASMLVISRVSTTLMRG